MKDAICLPATQGARASVICPSGNCVDSPAYYPLRREGFEPPPIVPVPGREAFEPPQYVIDLPTG